jgi:hypothetical protein
MRSIDDYDDRVDPMGRILSRKFLYHECNADEQVKHDRHHHSPKKEFLFREYSNEKLTS